MLTGHIVFGCSSLKSILRLLVEIRETSMKNCLLAFILAIATSPAFGDAELKGSPDELRKILHPIVVKEQEKTYEKITIDGDAEVTAYSDQAIVSVIVVTEGETLSKALSRNHEIRSNIEQKLIAAGVQPQNINSSKFSTSSDYGWFGSKPKSYEVANRMAINVTQENQFKEIALVADAHEEVSIAGTEFKHSEKDAYTLMVREMAIKNAMEKRALYEETIGLKLKPIRFLQRRNAYTRTQGASMLEEVVVTGIRQGAERKKKKEEAVVPKPTRKTSFDEISYDASISITFEIIVD